MQCCPFVLLERACLLCQVFLTNSSFLSMPDSRLAAQSEGGLTGTVWLPSRIAWQFLQRLSLFCEQTQSGYFQMSPDCFVASLLQVSCIRLVSSALWGKDRSPGPEFMQTLWTDRQTDRQTAWLGSPGEEGHRLRRQERLVDIS